MGKRAAECLIAEIGVDMTVFPTAGHLATWAGRCPGNNMHRRKTALGPDQHGQPLAGGDPHRVRLGRGPHRDTYLSAQYWRLARRIGKKKAASPSGHSILVIAWHLPPTTATRTTLVATTSPGATPTGQRQRAVAHLKALG